MEQSRTFPAVHPPQPMQAPGLLHLAQLVAVLEGACLLILGLVVLLLEAILALTGGSASVVLAGLGGGIAAAAVALILAAFQVARPSQRARWLLVSAQVVLAGHALLWVSTSTVVTGAEVVICETIASVTGLYVLLGDRPTRVFLAQRPSAARAARLPQPSDTSEPMWLRVSRLIIHVQALVAISAGWVTAVLMYVLQMSTTRDASLLQFAGACGAATAIAGWVLLAASSRLLRRTAHDLSTVTWMSVMVIEAAFAAAAVDVLLAAAGSGGGLWIGVSVAAAWLTFISAVTVMFGIAIDPAARHAWFAPDAPARPGEGLMFARGVVVAEAASLLLAGITLVAFTVAAATANGEREAIGIGVQILGGTAFFGVAGIVVGALWLTAALQLARADEAARWAVIVGSALIVVADAAAAILVPPPTLFTTPVPPPASIVAVALAGMVAGVATIRALLHPTTRARLDEVRGVSR